MAQPTFANINGQNTGSIIPTGGTPGTPLAPAPIQTPTSLSTPSTPPQISAQPVVSPLQQPLQPQSEDEIYSNYVQQGQSVIDQINNSTAAQIAAANQQIDLAASKSQQDQNAVAAITGNFGSSSVAGADAVAQTASSQKQTAAATAQAQGAQQLSQYLQSLQTAAASQENYEQSTAFSQGITYDQYLKQTASSTLQGMSAQGVTLQTLQTQASQGNTVAQTALQNLLQAYGGDQNALSAAAALATPAPNVAQAWTQGSTYYQIVKNPQTGAVSLQQFDLGTTIPQGATVQKVSTTSSLLTLPDGSIVSLTSDPLTGQLTASGGGTPAAQNIINQINAQQSSSTAPSSSAPASSPSGSNYISTATTTAGVSDPTTPFSSAVSSVGIGSLVNGVIQAEGGSLPGVQNNPGNVKYVAGLPGATDSGVKATDGGTFANFATPEQGQQAIASTLQTIAQNQGADSTVQDVLNKYANLSGIGAKNSSGTPTTGTNGLSTAQYGKLANVAGFNPTVPGKDQAAYNYLSEYLNGQTPSAASVGVSTRSGSGEVFNTIAERAREVYQQATGQALPNQTVLQSNLALVSKNNALLNNLNVQTGVITKNFGLNLQNLNDNNVNQAAPAINGIADYLSQAAGSTSVAQYLTQNATLQQEIGGLLSIKNASGVTVADKIAAGDLLPSDLSADQQKQILSTFIKEAKNQQQAIGSATESLYQQTDPLGIDPNNPVNTPGYQEFSSAGFKNNYDGTFDAPDGSVWKADAQGNPVQVQ